MDIQDEELLNMLIIDSFRLLNSRAQTYVRLEIARGGLTEPQVNAMMEIVSQDGLSISELSKRLHLNHSTVSGIVDRLEARGLIIRKQDAQDGRFTRIYAAERISSYMKRRIYDRYMPFLEAVRRATPEEKQKIADGFATFDRLLREAEESHQTESEPEPEQ